MQGPPQEATKEPQEAGETQDKDAPAEQGEDEKAEDSEEGKLETQPHESEVAPTNEGTVVGGEDAGPMEESPEIAETAPLEGFGLQKSEAIMIDDIPVLEDIREEGEEEEEEENEEVRRELLESIMDAVAERDRMQSLSNQVQSEIAEYLARKKVIN